MTEAATLPVTIQHGPKALKGHRGYRPGHPKNPYSSLGLWYYVPIYNKAHFAHRAYLIAQGRAGVELNRTLPYFGLSNPQDYLRDLAQFEPILDDLGAPILNPTTGRPATRTVPTSGAIGMWDVNQAFGWGTDMNVYRGRTWFTDSGATGTFTSGQIDMNQFYGKRGSDPVSPGAWDQQGTGYYDFYTPLHRWIQRQHVGGGGGGGGGAGGHGAAGGDTWSFTGGNPAKAGTGGGFLYSGGQNGPWGTENEHVGVGGSWNTPGNANNIAGSNGGTVGGTGYLWIFNTGGGGGSAWGAGGASFQGNIDAGARAANSGVFGSGSSGGFSPLNGGLWGWGDGGGGAGYTYDSWGAGVIGGVVNVYSAGGGGCPSGGQGGNGRIYVDWG